MGFDLGREARLLLAAIQFLTRLPLRPSAYDPDWLARGAKYFPVVGLAVGLAGGLVLAGADRLWPDPIPALLAVGAMLLLTGALHEDGLADVADAAGGPTREARLAIMKDPRLGVFGALALGFAVALKVASLVAMPVAVAVAALAGAGAGGRAAAVIVMRTTPYAGDPARARAPHGRSRPNGAETGFAVAIGILALAMLPVATAACGLMLAALAAWLAASPACRGLGGHNGDVLGATIVVYETAFLLGVAGGWRWF